MVPLPAHGPPLERVLEGIHLFQRQAPVILSRLGEAGVASEPDLLIQSVDNSTAAERREV